MDELREYTRKAGEELRQLGVETAETTLQVYRDPAGVIHNDNRRHSCNDHPNPAVEVPLDTTDPACPDCTWAEVPAHQAGLYWPSIERLIKAETATAELRAVRDDPVETLEDCRRLAEVLRRTPRGADVYDVVADRVAEQLDGALKEEFLGGLVEKALEKLDEHTRLLRSQGLVRAAEAAETAGRFAREELTEGGMVLMHLTHGWSREELLSLAARRWRVQGGVYLVPHVVYAHRRAGSEPVRDAVFLDEVPERDVLETAAVLYDPEGDGPYSRLAAALDAATHL